MPKPAESESKRPDQDALPGSKAMIAKKDLIPGAMYFGDHRQSQFAVWDGKRQEFVYIRHKFAQFFTDTARHPEDDDGYALFVPLEKLGRKFTDEEMEEVIRWRKKEAAK